MTEPITDFRFEWMLREQRLIMVEGFADVRAGWRATVEMVDPESGESHIINALSSHDASWMQMESWPAEANGCWLAMGPTQVPLGIQGLVRAEPSYISLLGGLQAEGFAGSAQGRFTGELTLAGALTLLQAQTLEHIDIDESTAADHTVPVRITHQDGRLTGVSLTGEELGQGVEDAGGSMPPQVATILDASEFTVTYTAHTGDDTIEAPDDELVMSGDGTGCHE